MHPDWIFLLRGDKHFRAFPSLTPRTHRFNALGDADFCNSECRKASGSGFATERQRASAYIRPATPEASAEAAVTWSDAAVHRAWTHSGGGVMSRLATAHARLARSR